MSTLLLYPEREQIVEYCQRLTRSGLSHGTSGNISILSSEQGLVAISPSGSGYATMQPADVVVIDKEGTVVEGDCKPSSEVDLHRFCYLERDDIGAVVHTHSTKATTLAVLGWALPAVHYLVGLGGAATIPCAPYQPFGSRELGRAAMETLAGGYACLLANHGVLALGKDVNAAFALAEQIEFCANLYVSAKLLGEPKILSEEQMADVQQRLNHYLRQQE